MVRSLDLKTVQLVPHLLWMEERCDQVAQCRDKSDEVTCRRLMLESSYEKTIPPITTISATNFTVVPVPVKVSILLMKIIKMEEVEHKIDLQFQITLQWNENRATFLNLKTETSLNALKENDIQQLWLPDVVYDNTDQKESTKLGDWKTSITITRKGNLTRAGSEEVDETEIFQGADNELTMQQTYTHNFQCEYMLHRYPFDTQASSNATYFIVFRCVQLR